MRVSYYMASLVMLLCVVLTKEWLHFAVVAAAIALGIADQFLEAYKNRVVHINLPKLITIEQRADAAQEREEG